MKLSEYLLHCEKFIKDYMDDSHTSGYVLGLSGGVDSSLVAAMTKKAVGKDKLTVVMIPIDSSPKDLKDGEEIVKRFSLNALTIDGSDIYHTFFNELKNKGVEIDSLTSANLKARIRMSILYAIAQMNNALVIGTDNADERYTGYFTKYGDGGVDILPISHLLKHEVVEAARIYGVPEHLATRIPSAGLFEGQTDEREMGVTYQDIDDLLLGKQINPASKRRIEFLHRISEHKRKEIPTPIPFDRD